jgi:hypothetical protein
VLDRSMVTMVRDTSVYSLESFKKRMKAAGEAQVNIGSASSFATTLPQLLFFSLFTLTIPFRSSSIVSQQICRALSTGKRIDLKGGRFPNCRNRQRFEGHGHFQSLFEMGTEEDAEQRKVQKKKEDGELDEDRKKGEKGWRYGAVSLHCSLCFAITKVMKDKLTRDVLLWSMR